MLGAQDRRRARKTKLLMDKINKNKISLLHISIDDSISITSIKKLVWEYFEWGNVCLQENYGYQLDINEMMKTFISELPMYCLPETRLYVVNYENDIIGLGGYKKKDETEVELKRVYLQTEYRGNGFGRLIVSKLIEDAKNYGFEKMILESADFMQEAFNLYKSLGFVKIPNYQGIETPNAFASNIYCMELKLQKN